MTQQKQDEEEDITVIVNRSIIEGV